MSPELLAILFAIIAVISYGLYARIYEPLTRLHHNDQNNTLNETDTSFAAIGLYAISATFLFAISAISAVLFGVNFRLPNQTYVYGFLLETTTSISIGLSLLVLLMSTSYYLHIKTEASSRRNINMGTYAIVFQLNILVIAALDWWRYRQTPNLGILVGGILIFTSNIAILISHLPYFSSRNRSIVVSARNQSTLLKGIILALISAISCGLALFIDGEVGRNYIFLSKPHLPEIAQKLTVFLFYEALTFGIPAILLTCDRSRIYGILTTLFKLRQTIRGHEIKFCLAAIFSAAQFVFSVLALSTEDPLVVAILLAMSPVFNIWLDKNMRSQRRKLAEYSLAFISMIGVVIMLLNL